MKRPSKHFSVQHLKDLHTPEAIQARLELGSRHSYLRDMVYGAMDGSVTTFAVVAGVAGANLSDHIVIIMGFANLVADGFSMAAGNFLGTRAEQELLAQARRMEESHIDHYPEGEVEEVRQIFAAKGFHGEELEKAVRVITSDRKQWVDTMLKEELGLTLEGPRPFPAASTTFISFSIAGLCPLLSYFANMIFPGFIQNPFSASIVITGCIFFLIGALKSRFVGRRWYVAGLETLFVGGIAAALAYVAGIFLKSLPF